MGTPLGCKELPLLNDKRQLISNVWLRQEYKACLPYLNLVQFSRVIPTPELPIELLRLQLKLHWGPVKDCTSYLPHFLRGISPTDFCMQLSTSEFVCREPSPKYCSVRSHYTPNVIVPFII